MKKKIKPIILEDLKYYKKIRKIAAPSKKTIKSKKDKEREDRKIWKKDIEE
jgi:hypothetical protein